MTRDRRIEIIRREFEIGDVDYITAIEDLQRYCAFSPLEAETMVSDWDEAGLPPPPNIAKVEGGEK